MTSSRHEVATDRSEPRSAHGQGSRRLRRPQILLGMLAWLAATNSTLFGAVAGDGFSYQKMAAAAPGLPDELVASAYTGRLVPHYLVGLLADVPGVSLAAAYAVALTLTVAALVVVLHRLLEPFPLAVYVLSAGLVLLSPYSVRIFLVTPSTFQDLVFVVGLATCTLGLLRHRPELVLVGLVVALLGRQSALPVVAVAAVWVLVDRGGRQRSVAARGALAITALALVVGTYLLLRTVTAPFSEDFEPHIPADTILPLLGSLPATASDLGAHLARAVVPLLTSLSVLVAAVLLRRRHGLPAFTWQATGCLLLAASVIAQPIAISPYFPGFASNEQRLSALGLVPLVVALSLLLAPVLVRASAPACLGLVGLLLLGSLHHLFTFVGPPSTSVFLVLQVAVAVALPVVVWFVAAGRDRRDTAPQTSG